MSRRLLISRTPGEAWMVAEKDGEATDLWLERDAFPSLLGRHFMARVRSVEPGLGGAFLDLGAAGDAFLDLGGAAKRPAEGELILVRITQDGVAGKAPRARTGAVLAGPSLIFDPSAERHSVSRRLKKSPAVSRLIDAAIGWTGTGAFVFRKGADQMGEGALRSEAALLRERHREMIDRSAGMKEAGALEPGRGWIEDFLIAFFEGGLGAIDYDDAELRPALERTVQRWPSLANVPMHFHPGAAGPMFEETGIAETIDTLHLDSVPLPSGARLHVEPTRAATMIDVDSGTAQLRGGKSRALADVNREAAGGIAKQMRLRNLGGMILADFAGASAGRPDGNLLGALKAAVADDPQNVRVLGYSKLGLVEMTRRRGRRPLHEIVAGNEDARRLTALTNLLGTLLHAVRRGGGRWPVGRASPTLFGELQKPVGAAAWRELNRKAGAAVEIRVDESCPDLKFEID